MAIDSPTIFAPVIKDFRKWYNVVSPSMTISEREACEKIMQNVDVPSAAWKRPHKHPLYAGAVRDNGLSLSFATFYCLRLIYVDHYKEVLRMLKLMRPHAGPRRVNVEKVRGRFKLGALADLARARFGTGILWGEPGDLTDLFSRICLQDLKQAEKPEESEEEHDRSTVTTRKEKTGTQSPAKENNIASFLTLRRSARRQQYQPGFYKGMDPKKEDDIYADLEYLEKDTGNNLDFQQSYYCLSSSGNFQSRGVPEKYESRVDIAMSSDEVPTSLGMHLPVPDTSFRAPGFVVAVSTSFKASTDALNSGVIPDYDSVEIATGTSNSISGFGMTLSDKELLHEVYKELKKDGTWNELEKSSYPPKVAWNTNQSRRLSQQLTSEGGSAVGFKGKGVGEGPYEETPKPRKQMKNIIASMKARGQKKIRKIGDK